MKKLIGLSLSLCIKDIIEGKVHKEQVDKIVARTMANDAEQWLRILVSYLNSHWHEKPIEAVSTLSYFLSRNKIVQPRLEGEPVHSIADGHWQESEVEYLPGG